jgi:sarcosine oxidase subunit gamma
MSASASASSSASASAFVRTSPVHYALEKPATKWGVLAGMPIALHFGDPKREAAQATVLGLCDVSAFPRMVVKGPGASVWVKSRDIPVPDSIYDVALAGRGGYQVIRTGAEEIFIEDGWTSDIVAHTGQALRASTAGPIEVMRQDASFLISGDRAREVFAQTCGVDFRKQTNQLVMSRVAGVSAGIRFRSELKVPAYQVWLDPSYGPYLWEALAEIAGELGGHIVGMECFGAEGAPKGNLQ